MKKANYLRLSIFCINHFTKNTYKSRYPKNKINSTLLSFCYHRLYPSDSKIKLCLFPSVLARGKFTIILSDPSVTKKKKLLKLKSQNLTVSWVRLLFPVLEACFPSFGRKTIYPNRYFMISRCTAC